jgi:hypothetical protein
VELAFLALATFFALWLIHTLAITSGSQETLIDEGSLTMSAERKRMLVEAENAQRFDLGFRGE